MQDLPIQSSFLEVFEQETLKRKSDKINEPKIYSQTISTSGFTKSYIEFSKDMKGQNWSSSIGQINVCIFWLNGLVPSSIPRFMCVYRFLNTGLCRKSGKESSKAISKHRKFIGKKNEKQEYEIYLPEVYSLGGVWKEPMERKEKNESNIYSSKIHSDQC